MQQAEMGRSPGCGCAPTGKADEFTASTFVLASVDLHHGHVSDHADIQLSNVETLLRSASEVAEEGGAVEGFWYRQAGWERQRFQQIERLIGLAARELEQLGSMLSAASLAPGVTL